MKLQTKHIIHSLAQKCSKLPAPLHLIAICSGGITVAKEMKRYLREKKISAQYFELWTNTLEGKRSIWKTNFKKEDYVGTAVLVDDVIWRGGALPPAKKMLRGMKRKRVYVAAILDCNHKADFSVYQ